MLRCYRSLVDDDSSVSLRFFRNDSRQQNQWAEIRVDIPLDSKQKEVSLVFDESFSKLKGSVKVKLFRIPSNELEDSDGSSSSLRKRPSSPNLSEHLAEDEGKKTPNLSRSNTKKNLIKGFKEMFRNKGTNSAGKSNAVSGPRAFGRAMQPNDRIADIFMQCVDVLETRGIYPFVVCIELKLFVSKLIF